VSGIYKIIGKFLANRLKMVLEKIIYVIVCMNGLDTKGEGFSSCFIQPVLSLHTHLTI
jgi:hypothetical protein